MIPTQNVASLFRLRAIRHNHKRDRTILSGMRKLCERRAIASLVPALALRVHFLPFHRQHEIGDQFRIRPIRLNVPGRLSLPMILPHFNFKS